MRDTVGGRRQRAWVCVLIAVIVGCNGPRDEPALPFSGQVERTTSAEAGPLELRVVKVDYYSSRTGSGPSSAMLFLKMTNRGARTALIFDGYDWTTTIQPGEEPPEGPPYYLMDDAGRTYAVQCCGWSKVVGDPVRVGTVPPGYTAAFNMSSLHGIPSDVAELTLFMNNVRTQGRRTYDIEIPVPLPPAESSRAER